MTKLCPRGKAAAKRKFRVYPSAYANAYTSKICAGKIKDPSGVKKKILEDLNLVKLKAVLQNPRMAKELLDGYIQKGMKKKGGQDESPNCVPAGAMKTRRA